MDTKRIPECSRLDDDDEGLHIGAAAACATIARRGLGLSRGALRLVDSMGSVVIHVHWRTQEVNDAL